MLSLLWNKSLTGDVERMAIPTVPLWWSLAIEAPKKALYST